MQKKYSINTENGEVQSIEVDGVRYASVDDIPDAADRRKIELLLSDADSAPDDALSDAEFDAQFEHLEQEAAQVERETRHIPALITAIFGGIAALMLIIAIISTVFNLRRLSNEVSAPGQVVEMVERRSVDSETREVTYYSYPVITFASADRELHRVQLAEGSWPPAYEVGDRVTVRYEPEHPLDARIQSLSSSILMWLLPGITGLVGVAFLGAVWLVTRLTRSDPDPAAPVLSTP
jgi:hypothetical protein